MSAGAARVTPGPASWGKNPEPPGGGGNSSLFEWGRLISHLGICAFYYVLCSIIKLFQ